MNCEKVKQLWHELFDEELTANQKTSIDLHLQSCDHCRNYYQQMNNVTKGLDQLRYDSQAIGGLNTHTIKTAKTQTNKQQHNRLHIWRIGKIAATIALVIGSGLILTLNPPLNQHKNPIIHAPAQEIASAVPNPTTANLILTGDSASEYIPVEQKTSLPGVHMFVLFKTTGNQ